MNLRSFLYSGSYGPQGIRIWEQSGDGSALVHKADLPEFRDASFVLAHPQLPLLYAGIETGAGLLACIRLGADGLPAHARQFSTGTRFPCHVAVSPGGESLAVSGYNGGFVFYELGPDGFPADEGRGRQLFHFAGSGPRADRQEMAHPHSVTFVGEDLALGADLGADCLRVFRRGGGLWHAVGSVPVAAGSGPRHGFAAAAGFFLVNELEPAVLLYSREAVAAELAALPASALPDRVLGVEPAATVPLLDIPDPAVTAAAVFMGVASGQVWATLRGQDALVRIDWPGAAGSTGAAEPALARFPLPWPQPRYGGFVAGLGGREAGGLAAGKITKKNELQNRNEEFIAIGFQAGGRLALYRTSDLQGKELPEPACVVDCQLCTAAAQVIIRGT